MLSPSILHAFILPSTNAHLLPYFSFLLLPNLRCCSERSKRRTKTVLNTCNPIWSQSFVYSAIRTTDLLQRVLEVTIWDYDRYGANEFLGEVTIDLGGIARASAAGITLENLEATWHQLSMVHGNGNAGTAPADLGAGVRKEGRQAGWLAGWLAA